MIVDQLMTMRAIQSDADTKKAQAQAQADVDKAPFVASAEAICKRYGFALKDLGESWLLDPETRVLTHVEHKAPGK